MKLVLYQYPGGDGIASISPPCLRVDLAMRWLGKPYDRRDIRDPKITRRVSPINRLPALEIDGQYFAESTRILDELERRFDVPWKVDDPHEATHLRLWEYTVNDYLYWCGFSMRWVDPVGRDLFLGALLKDAPWIKRFVIQHLFSRKQVRRAQLHSAGQRPIAHLVEEIDRNLAMLETDLRGGAFLLGRAQPSRADLTVLSLLSQCGFFDSMPAVKDRVEARPELVAYLQRIAAVCGGEIPRWLE